VNELSGFYVSMIFIGVVLVLVSLVLIMIDRKNVFVFKNSADEKKKELIEIISDAEQMIEELNRFSGYIVDQMDLKNDELNRNIMEAEQKINALIEKVRLASEGQMIPEKNAEVRKKDAVGCTEAKSLQLAAETVKAAVSASREMPDIYEAEKADGVRACIAASPAGSVAAAYSRNSARNAARKKDNVIQFNKYQEVLRLSREGMDELEIAKNLNMGKGEVELIIGLRR